MFEVKITGTSLLELAQNVSALAIQLGTAPSIRTQPDAPAVENKPAPKKATPAKKAEPAPEPEATVAAKPTPKALDFNTQVAPKVVAAVENHGKELVASVLDNFGVTRASEMEPALWPEFLVALDDAIAANV